MGKHRVTLNELKRILRHYGAVADESAGKGSHIKFWKQFPDGRFSYPIPNERDVLPCYVKGARKKFRLQPEDGVTDDDFFSQGLYLCERHRCGWLAVCEANPGE